MESSPLELYESAYRLHYVEQKLAEACRNYEAIIKKFPDSSECGYAAIQLQKIAAQDVAKSLKVKNGISPLITALAIVNILALVGGGLFLMSHIRKVELRLQSLSAATRAMGKLLIEEDGQALALLEEARAATPTEAALYFLAADIHESGNRFDQAIAEYEKMRDILPNQPIPQSDIGRIELKTEALKSRRKPKTTPPPPPQESFNTPREIESRLSGNKAAPPKRLVRSGSKSPLIVSQDSISFF